MNEQEPLFKDLPTNDKEAREVFKKCDDITHIGPIVLAKNVDKEKFENWLHDHELGLHKSVRTDEGLVYISQACANDHGRLRQYLGDGARFRILNFHAGEDYLMEAFSGSEGGLNPDVKWMEIHSENDIATVVFEVGISQSLPDLRRKAYRFCNSADHPCLEFVVLIKRYPTFRLYIEIWRKKQNGRGPPYRDDSFTGDQRNPRELGPFPNMEFVTNAHAEDVTRRATVAAAVAWQRGLDTTCSIFRHEIAKRYNANGELIPRQTRLDGTVTFDAESMVAYCRWKDVTQNR